MSGSTHGMSAALHDQNPDVRIEAIGRAARLPDAQGLPLLVGMLGDAEWRVRKAAANDLKRRHPTPALLTELITAITSSDDPWKRMTAIDVTVSLGADDELGDRVVEALLAALNSTGIDERKFVVEVLGLLGAAETVRPLIEQLRAGDENLRISILDALAKIGDRRALPAVLDQLREGASSVRFAALTSLQLLGDASSESAVLEAMQDATLSPTAMDVLACIGGEQAIVSLWQRWTEGPERERHQALSALAQIVRRASPERRDEWLRLLRHRYRPSHRAGLLAALTATDPVAQRAAISLAGWVREAEAVMPLVHLLGGESAGEAKQALSMMASDHVDRLLELLPRSTPTIYRALVELLAGTAAPPVLPVLQEALTSIDGRVRRAAVLGIAAQGDRDSAASLVGLLLDQEPDVQEAAVWALGRCGHDAVVAPLVTLLDGDSPAVRVLAARALGLVQSVEGRDPLARALHDPDAAVRKAAVVALDQSGNRDRASASGQRSDATLNEHFLLALGDEAAGVRLEAARALQRRTATLPVHWWHCLAEDADQWVRAVAARSAATGGKAHGALLRRYLQDESGAVRIAALEAVAGHPEAGDFEAVRQAMHSDDPDVIAAALTALSAMTARRTARSWNQNGCSPRLIDDVLQTLAHPVWTVRASGMRVLMSIAPSRARKRLVALAADDPHPLVREEASRLLATALARRTRRSSARPGKRPVKRMVRR